MELRINDTKPLYSLSIGEFIQLTQQVISTLIKEEIIKAKQPIIENDENFNIQKCAEFLECSIVTIHNYKKAGLPFYRIGRTIMFKKSELLAYMRDNTRFQKPKHKRNVYKKQPS